MLLVDDHDPIIFNTTGRRTGGRRSELGGRNPIEARARALVEGFNDLDIAPDRRSGVVATYQLVAQALK